MKWDVQKLKEVSDYWNGRIDSCEINETNYVSTENLVPNKNDVL